MKIAYWSKKDTQSEPAEDFSPDIIVDVSNILTEKDSATENAGRNGISLLERTTEPLMFGGKDPEEYEDPNKPDIEEQERVDKKVFDILVELGDGLDKSGSYELADFADFLIKKFAESKSINYSKKYNELMLKINNSDLPNRNEILKKLTKIFSRTLILEESKHGDKKKAEESAYKKTLHRADQYLSD